MYLNSVAQGKEYRVHRLLLAYSSEYFSRLLLSNFQEGRQTHIRLRFPDPANVFPLVLQVSCRRLPILQLPCMHGHVCTAGW
jgi:hypothetical protein